MNGDPQVREITFVSITLGIILAMTMCAAMAYVGLYAGFTITASIPAAVISMALLKLLQKTMGRPGNIRENNIVQTMTSAGEALAAGTIFTIPALIITKVWSGFDYWTVTLIAMSGGVLGVLFMIPIRRVLIAQDKYELTYPEGVACAEVLRVGEEGGKGALYILTAIGVAGAFKFLTSGIKLLKGNVQRAFAVGDSGLYLGVDLSPALMGIGYIVGINVGFMVVLGGLLGWFVGIPILLLNNPAPADGLLDHMWMLWSTKIRYTGIGAMVVGGIWSIASIRQGVVEGLQQMVASFKRSTDKSAAVERTNLDMDLRSILIIIGLNLIVIGGLYTVLTNSAGIGVLTTVIMVIAAFFFVAVSSYISGLIGNGSNPVSGMVICTVMFTAGVMLMFGFKGTTAVLATLGVAGVVCCAAASAGDICQDLKTGYLVGATPRAQQWAQIVGVVISAFILAPVMALLHSAYGIGTGEPGSLMAPQASMFAGIAEGMFLKTTGLPWKFIFVGVGIGVVVIVVDEIFKRSSRNIRLHVLPVATGIYLPLLITTPIFLGGLINYIVGRSLRDRAAKEKQEAMGRGTLVSAGFVAGEAIIGIFVAMAIVFKDKLHIDFPVDVWGPAASGWVDLLSLVTFALIITFLAFITRSTKLNHD